MELPDKNTDANQFGVILHQLDIVYASHAIMVSACANSLGMEILLWVSILFRFAAFFFVRFALQSTDDECTS